MNDAKNSIIFLVFGIPMNYLFWRLGVEYGYR
jgi:hypothetical protein